MDRHNNHYNHYIIMFFIMIISGLLSTMNIWVDNISHIRLSLNDLYMILLMTGWMLFFMGIIYKEFIVIVIGFILVVLNVYLIRTQMFINEYQYRIGMIPHHSMAIHMSKKLLEKENEINEFLRNLIKTQEKEISILS